jgi:N-acetylglutamate synthase-like GNAT family acetyltransferase
MTAFRIRRAEPGEAVRLTAIAHAAKRHWGYADELIALWADDLTVTADEVVARAFWCVEEDGAIAGFCALSPDGAELDHLWVDPPAMGRGHGAALLRHAIACARALGGDVLGIASDPHAEPFYLRMGALRAGEVASTPAGRVLPLLVVRLDERRSGDA